MGGSGDLLKHGLTNLPFVRLVDQAVPTFGFLSLGYRFESLLYTVWEQRDSKDFNEMLLHDIVTIFLFVGYLFGYMHSIGTLIIFVHDLTDIPFQIAKAINTTVLHELAIYPFILGQLMWVYFRLFCLPLMIY